MKIRVRYEQVRAAEKPPLSDRYIPQTRRFGAGFLGRKGISGVSQL